MNCRHCGAVVSQVFIDLGTAPPSNAYLTETDLLAPETWYPLRVVVCRECWLVQTEDYADRSQLFSSDYAYFSSFSTTWLAHAERYVDRVVRRFGLGSKSMVVEVASNDGYLLQYVRAHGVPCIGIEPTHSTATACRGKGIDVVEDFFGVAVAERLAAKGVMADLLIANNVLAHVPDINDFVAAFARLLSPNGVATFEFPHVQKLVAQSAFDTIYHEHFSYLSLASVDLIFGANGLSIFDVEELNTHGGSLRVYAQRSDSGRRSVSESVERCRVDELGSGIKSEFFYDQLRQAAMRVKDEILRFLLDAKRAERKVVGYGAAAKGNTLINYAGIRSDLLPWIVDRNPAKQGKYTPGGRIPIVAEEHLRQQKPAYVWILPWNLQDELMEQLAYIRGWGGRFVVAVPELKIV